MEEKLIPRLTFNPRLALTAFRTTRSWLTETAGKTCTLWQAWANMQPTEIAGKHVVTSDKLHGNLQLLTSAGKHVTT